MCRSELLNLLDFLKEIMPFAYLTKSPKLHLETGNKYAIGIVIQPGPQGVMGAMKLFLTNPSQVANFWGHTAIYIRINGSILKATGFDPHRFAMFNIMGKESRGVATGTLATKGYIYDEDKMFSSPDMICVEFKVNKNDAEKILKHTKKPGISEGLMTQYVTRGGQCLKDMEFDPKTMGNCINYVNSIIKKANIELHVPFERDGHLSLLKPAQGKLITPAMNGEIKLKRRINGIVSYNGGGVFAMPKMYQITRRMGGTKNSFLS